MHKSLSGILRIQRDGEKEKKEGRRRHGQEGNQPFYQKKGGKKGGKKRKKTANMAQTEKKEASRIARVNGHACESAARGKGKGKHPRNLLKKRKGEMEKKMRTVKPKNGSQNR